MFFEGSFHIWCKCFVKIKKIVILILTFWGMHLGFIWVLLGSFWASFWRPFGVQLGSETVWGPKRNQKVSRSEKGEMRTPDRLESPPSLLYFLDKRRSESCFFNMCFAGAVFHRIHLNSWVPRTPIIKLKRCRAVQNQGFVNLGKVWKTSPSYVHFDVILETFGRQHFFF